MANSVPSKPTEWCFDSRYCELRTVGSPTHFDLNRHRHDRHHRPQVENLIAVHFLFFFVCETPSSPTPHPPVHSPIAATETENLNTGSEHSAPDFSDLNWKKSRKGKAKDLPFGGGTCRTARSRFPSYCWNRWLVSVSDTSSRPARGAASFTPSPFSCSRRLALLCLWCSFTAALGAGLPPMWRPHADGPPGTVHIPAVVDRHTS